MKQKLFLGIIFLTLALFSIIGISAATGSINMTSPLDGIVTGTLFINVTNISSDFKQMVNCTFVFTSSITANTSVNIGTITNQSKVHVNTSYNTTALEDGINYLLTATCRNRTNDIAINTSTLTIDNTVPTTPSSPSPSDLGSISSATTQNFSQTVVGRETTSCTYIINRNGQNTGPDYITGTSTHTGDTCSFTKDFTNLLNGNWCWTQTASDGLNTSQSSQSCVSVTIPANGGGLPGGAVVDEDGDIIIIGDGDGDNNLIAWIMGIFVFALLIWLVVWLSKR